MDKVTNLSDAIRRFDGALCINLDDRQDRWDYQIEQFKRFKIDDFVERLPGVDLRKDYTNTKHDTRWPHVNYSKLGTTGCILSHLKAVRTARDRGWKNVIIFEDDATFIEDNLDNVTKSVEDLLCQDWELFYFGATYRGPMSRVTKNLLRVDTGAYALHAYCMNSSVFNRLLHVIPDDPEEILTTERVNGEIVAADTYLPYIINNHLTFATDPIMCTQRDNFSNISIRETPGMRQMQLDFFEKWKPM